MQTNPLKLLLGLLVILGSASAAWGYTFIFSGTNMPIKWPPGSVVMNVMADNTTKLSDGTTQATCITAAMLDPQRGWNHYLGIFQFNPQIKPAGNGHDGNNINEIFFSSSPYGQNWDANTLAVTTTWSSNTDGNQRVEADIIFNTSFTWDSYRGNLRSGAYDIQRVVLHELGHVLGLDHPDQATPPQNVSADMNSIISNIDSLTADDIGGGQALYGAPGVVPANDNFANASVITLANNTATVTGSNVAATKQTGEPNNAGATGGHSVWWKWTAPASGRVSLNMQGSLFDTTLGVYTGSSVAALSTIASDDDVQDGVIQYSALTFSAARATTYYFEVDGFDADEAAITLKVTLATSGDFNGDGKPDILWENTSTGDRSIWLMNGTSLVNFIYLAYIPTDWRIAGAADFNGDGQTDILWENASTGDRSIWLMSGTTLASFAYLAYVDPVWHIAAVGDFNGDGQPDIIWENTSTGDRSIWLMNGTSISSFVYLAYVDPVWRIAGAADFNGDGQTDIIWENTSTGDRSIWLMNGTSLSSIVDLATVSPAWHIAAVADFNGDGQPDLLWENTTTGDRAFWLLNGTTRASSPYLANVPGAWHIAP